MIKSERKEDLLEASVERGIPVFQVMKLKSSNQSMPRRIAVCLQAKEGRAYEILENAIR